MIRVLHIPLHFTRPYPSASCISAEGDNFQALGIGCFLIGSTFQVSGVSVHFPAALQTNGRLRHAAGEAHEQSVDRDVSKAERCRHSAMIARMTTAMFMVIGGWCTIIVTNSKKAPQEMRSVRDTNPDGEHRRLNN